MSFIILKVIDTVIGLRVTEEEERGGLDLNLHGERVEFDPERSFAPSATRTS